MLEDGFLQIWFVCIASLGLFACRNSWGCERWMWTIWIREAHWNPTSCWRSWCGRSWQGEFFALLFSAVSLLAAWLSDVQPVEKRVWSHHFCVSVPITPISNSFRRSWSRTSPPRNWLPVPVRQKGLLSLWLCSGWIPNYTTHNVAEWDALSGFLLVCRFMLSSNPHWRAPRPWKRLPAGSLRIVS